MKKYAPRSRAPQQDSQSLNSSLSSKKSNSNTSKNKSPFVDNRSKTVAQRQLQETANNSPQVQKAIQFQTVADTYLQQKQAEPSLEQTESTTQLQTANTPPPADTLPPPPPNNTGLPDQLKSGIETLSGHSMDDVKVHRNSSKPAQLQAHAYAQGSDIHLGPGQEKHLPHEAWHVAQQKQGRVKPTLQMKNKVNINDDAGLEKEADVMGAKALKNTAPSFKSMSSSSSEHTTYQLTKFSKEQTGNYGEMDTDDAEDVADFLETYNNGDLDKIDAEIFSELIKEITHNLEASNYQGATELPKIEKELKRLEVQASATLSPEETTRRLEIDEMHGKLMGIFESSSNKQRLDFIQNAYKDRSDVYIIYRGEWYKRSLSILENGTFGGLPKVDDKELLQTTDRTFTETVRLQKERGGDEPKKIINEWTTDLGIAQNYGGNFVKLIALIKKDAKDYVIYPDADTEGTGEQGVLADSRMGVLEVAILEMNPNPNYAKQNTTGS